MSKNSPYLLQGAVHAFGRSIFIVALVVLLVVVHFPTPVIGDGFAHAASDAECASDDADCDGLSDSVEDFDGDGIVDLFAGETDPNNPDTDGDGLTDGEERLHIGRVADALSRDDFDVAELDRLDPNNPDSDGDCLPDGLELGIDEGDARSLVARMKEKPTLEISARCRAVLEDNNVASFENAIAFDSAEEAGPSNASMLFDMDGDSLTDPTSSDTDGDGVPDGIEDYNFSGRRDSDGDDLEDGEGVDGEHVLWKEMDPLLPDSDGDGLVDGEEGDRDGDGELGSDESDPMNADTDGDGVTDGDEIRAGTGVNVCDTDGDGLTDGVEMGRIQPYDINGCHGLQPSGTNYSKPGEMDPRNPDSDGNGWIDSKDNDPSIVDTDGDGLGDGLETLGDFNGDGVPDFDFRMIDGGRECTPPEAIDDLDCDGVPNSRDDDSDDDGCPDSMEGAWTDANTNGIPDVYDADAKVCPEPSVGGGGGGSGGGDEGGETDGATDSKFSAFPAQDGGACSLVKRNYFGGSLVFLRFFSLFIIIMIIVPILSKRRRVTSKR
jgi:Bacterial TSP3 repeat